MSTSYRDINNNSLPTVANSTERLALIPGSDGYAVVQLDNSSIYVWSQNSQTWTNEGPPPVTSVFSRTGVVVAQSGDYNTSQVTENTNLYFTNARAIASTLTGYSSGSGTVSSSDSILQAIQKLNGNTVALTTSNVAEGSNLYFTNQRSKAIISSSSPSTITSASTYQILSTDSFIRVNSASNAITLQLPSISFSSGGSTWYPRIVIKDIGGNLSTNNLNILQNASEKIEGLAATKVFLTNYGSWILQSDGTDWWLI